MTKRKKVTSYGQSRNVNTSIRHDESRKLETSDVGAQVKQPWIQQQDGAKERQTCNIISKRRSIESYNKKEPKHLEHDVEVT